MNRRRRADTYDELDLDWRIDRQRRNAYGASRMPPRVAKDLYQHLTRAISYQWLVGEIRCACDVDRRLDDPGDHIKIAGQIDYGRQRIECRYPGTIDGVLDRDLRADLPGGPQGAIHNRDLAGGIHQVAESHGRQIGRCRRNDRRQAQSKIAEPFRWQAHVTVPEQELVA